MTTSVHKININTLVDHCPHQKQACLINFHSIEYFSNVILL